MLLTLLACSPGTITLDDTGPAQVDTADADTDTDTDTDTGTDTDTDTDTDTTPVWDVPGEYEGTIDGVWTYEDWEGEQELECSGPVFLTIDDSGNVTGEATCESDNYPLYGTLDGWADGGAVDGNWYVDFGWETMEMEYDGETGEGALSAAIEQDMGRGGYFEAWIAAERIGD